MAHCDMAILASKNDQLLEMSALRLTSFFALKLTVEEAVKVQMDALAQNDDPRLDHGLEVDN